MAGHVPGAPKPQALTGADNEVRFESERYCQCSPGVAYSILVGDESDTGDEDPVQV